MPREFRSPGGVFAENTVVNAIYRGVVQAPGLILVVIDDAGQGEAKNFFAEDYPRRGREACPPASEEGSRDRGGTRCRTGLQKRVIITVMGDGLGEEDARQAQRHTDRPMICSAGTWRSAESNWPRQNWASTAPIRWRPYMTR